MAKGYFSRGNKTVGLMDIICDEDFDSQVTMSIQGIVETYDIFVEGGYMLSIGETAQGVWSHAESPRGAVYSVAGDIRKVCQYYSQAIEYIKENADCAIWECDK